MNAEFVSIAQKIIIPLGIFSAFSFLTSASSSASKSTPAAKQHAKELQLKRTALQGPTRTIQDSVLVQTIYLLSVCFYVFKAVVIDLHFYEFFQIPASSKSYEVSTYCSNVLMHKGLAALPDRETIDPYTNAMIDLCSGVMSETNLSVLQTLGEYSLLGCTWCKEHQDYFIFGFAYILAYYIWFLIVIGLVTASNKMYPWRYISMIVVAIMFFSEVGLRLTEKTSIVFSYEWGFLVFESQHIFLQRIRCLVFAISVIALVLLSSSATKSWTEKDLLKTMINAALQTHAGNNCIDAIETVVFKDEPLSVLHRKYHNDANNLEKMFHKLPDSKNLKRNLLLKHNLPVIRNTAKNWVESMLRPVPPFLNQNTSDSTEKVEEVQPWSDFDKE